MGGVSLCPFYKFVDSFTTILAPKSTNDIQHHFTCISFQPIYCISCSRCGMRCIGETGKHLRTRFGEHRRAVYANDARHAAFGSSSELKIDKIFDTDANQ